MRAYIATGWLNRAKAEQLATTLEQEGIEITQKWWQNEDWDWEDVKTVELRAPVLAYRDLLGVVEADLFVLLVTDKQELRGALVEFGAALAVVPYVVVIGELVRNIFSHHPKVTHYDTVDQFLLVLQDRYV